MNKLQIKSYQNIKINQKLSLLHILTQTPNMGNHPSSTEQQQQNKIHINHPKFKDAKSIPQTDIIRSTITIQHEQDYQAWQRKLNKTVNIDDQVILLPKAYQYIRKAICGSSCTIQIDYDNYSYILADQLVNRRVEKKFFSEQEIWYLLYSLASAAYDFKKLNERIGDVRPENVFINEQGHIKTSNLFSWPGQANGYTKAVYDHQRTYLSPQQSQSARQGSAECFIDKFQAQSFSIGLTVLQTATLKDIKNLYYSNNGFDYQTFDRYLRDWWAFTYFNVDEKTGNTRSYQFSDMLKLTVAGLLELKPEDRLASEAVYNWLKGYHKEINELTPFTPQGYPPVKNIQKYQNRLKIGQQSSKPMPVQSRPQGNQPVQPSYNNNNSTGNQHYEIFKNYAGNQPTNMFNNNNNNNSSNNYYNSTNTNTNTNTYAQQQQQQQWSGGQYTQQQPSQFSMNSNNNSNNTQNVYYGSGKPAVSVLSNNQPTNNNYYNTNTSNTNNTNTYQPQQAQKQPLSQYQQYIYQQQQQQQQPINSGKYYSVSNSNNVGSYQTSNLAYNPTTTTTTTTTNQNYTPSITAADKITTTKYQGIATTTNTMTTTTLNNNNNNNNNNNAYNYNTYPYSANTNTNTNTNTGGYSSSINANTYNYSSNSYSQPQPKLQQSNEFLRNIDERLKALKQDFQ